MTRYSQQRHMASSFHPSHIQLSLSLNIECMNMNDLHVRIVVDTVVVGVTSLWHVVAHGAGASRGLGVGKLVFAGSFCNSPYHIVTSPLIPTPHLHLRKDAEEVSSITLNTLTLPLGPSTDRRQRHRTGGSRWHPAVSQTSPPRIPTQDRCSHHLAAIRLERLGQGWQDPLRHRCRRGREGKAALKDAFRSFGLALTHTLVRH